MLMMITRAIIFAYCVAGGRPSLPLDAMAGIQALLDADIILSGSTGAGSGESTLSVFPGSGVTRSDVTTRTPPQPSTGAIPHSTRRESELKRGVPHEATVSIPKRLKSTGVRLLDDLSDDRFELAFRRGEIIREYLIANNGSRNNYTVPILMEILAERGLPSIRPNSLRLAIINSCKQLGFPIWPKRRNPDILHRSSIIEQFIRENSRLPSGEMEAPINALLQQNGLAMFRSRRLQNVISVTRRKLGLPCRPPRRGSVAFLPPSRLHPGTTTTFSPTTSA